MNKSITLNQLIKELEKLAVENGDKLISSIGTSCGKLGGMNSPYCFRFEGEYDTHYVAAYQHDIKE